MLLFPLSSPSPSFITFPVTAEQLVKSSSKLHGSVLGGALDCKCSFVGISRIPGTYRLAANIVPFLLNRSEHRS